MKNINNNLREIKETETTLQDYISELDAKKLFKRSTTWFWELRKSGFPYTKLRGEIYYRKSDFVKYLEKNQRNDANKVV